jgi:hypothetical protein
VDGDEVLVVETGRIDAGASVLDTLRSRLNMEQKSAEGGTIAYADSAAVSNLHDWQPGV